MSELSARNVLAAMAGHRPDGLLNPAVLGSPNLRTPVQE